MADLTDHEEAQINEANASGRAPVVFVHELGSLAGVVPRCRLRPAGAWLARRPRDGGRGQRES
jgi:hypothetical protein